MTTTNAPDYPALQVLLQQVQAADEETLALAGAAWLEQLANDPYAAAVWQLLGVDTLDQWLWQFAGRAGLAPHLRDALDAVFFAVRGVGRLEPAVHVVLRHATAAAVLGHLVHVDGLSTHTLSVEHLNLLATPWRRALIARSQLGQATLDVQALAAVLLDDGWQAPLHDLLPTAQNLLR